MLVTHLVINSVSFLPWDFLMLFWVTININIAQVRNVKQASSSAGVLNSYLHS